MAFVAFVLAVLFPSLGKILQRLALRPAKLNNAITFFKNASEAAIEMRQTDEMQVKLLKNHK